MGDQEVGLTKSFGFMFNYNRELLGQFLRLAGFKGKVSRRLSQSTQVEVEVADRRRRTDIEIKLDDLLYVILEGKIRGNLPSIKQLRLYSNRLNRVNGQKILCIVTEVDASDQLTQQLFGSKADFSGLSRNEVTILTWKELHENLFSCLDLDDEIDRQFEDYLEEMIMPNEILVAAASPNAGSDDLDIFLKHHFYWYGIDALKKRHSYLALYLGKEFGKDQGIQYIAKILKYELCTWDQLGIPKDSVYYKRKIGVGHTFYKLVLGEPIKLPRKIGKSRGKRVYNWTTTFEKLLKARYTDELL
jgi:hypothetical protein